MTENEVATAIVDACLRIHMRLGPGLLESVYTRILEYELRKLGFGVRREEPIAFAYDGLEFDEGFRADLIVAGLVIVELKSVEYAAPVHKKQLLTYLKITGLKLGVLANFGMPLMKDGISRVANGVVD